MTSGKALANVAVAVVCFALGASVGLVGMRCFAEKPGSPNDTPVIPGRSAGITGTPGIPARVAIAKSMHSRLVSVGQHLPVLRSTGWVNGPPAAFAREPGVLVVVDVWGNWCSRCRESAPALLRIYEKYKGRGVSFVSLTTDGKAAVESFVGSFGIPWSHGFEADAELIAGLGSLNGDPMPPGYEVKPTLYLAKADGTVIWCDGHTRMNHAEDIRLWAERLESEISRNIAPPTTKNLAR